MNSFNGLLGRVRRLAADQHGSLTTMFALSLGAMIMGLGAAIDLARIVTARQILQQSIDSAAVAAVEIANDNGAGMENLTQTVRSYVTANMEAAGNPDAAAVRMQPTVTVTVEGTGLRVLAETHIPPGLTRIFGVQSLPVSASTRVSVEYDPALATDTVRITG